MIHRKFVRLLFLAAFLVVVTASALLPAMMAHHHCSGDDCPVCFCLVVCTNTLRILSLSLLAWVASLITLRTSAFFSASQCIIPSRSDLVALLVKLSR